MNSNVAKELESSRVVTDLVPQTYSCKWHLIADLSYPKHKSVNDGIPNNFCSLSYVTIDDVVHNIIEIGSQTELTKIAVKSAFCLIPVNPLDHLISHGMEYKYLH